jgi:hypothetical protein
LRQKKKEKRAKEMFSDAQVPQSLHNDEAKAKQKKKKPMKIMFDDDT